MKQVPRYLKIAAIIEQQINSQVLKIGEKLPSIRTLKDTYAVSINTIKAAYLELERKGIIEAKPKSGYFVHGQLKRSFRLPAVSQPKAGRKDQLTSTLIQRVMSTSEDPQIIQLSLNIPDSSLLPLSKLNKSLIKCAKNLPDHGTGYGPIQGSLHLRKNICRWSYHWGGSLTPEDIVLTSGAMNAIYNCLLATTAAGDTIAVESPVYFGLLQAAETLGLKVLEIPTHPQTGIEPDALRKALPQIKACVLTANFSNPLGSCMPDEHKKAVVQMLTERDIPLVEDDLYGNIHFGGTRPLPCKAFDTEGMVLWCSSFSKTLAPGYRVGFTAPGKYKDQILRQRLAQTISSPVLFQETIADFMENERYEHHLRGFRSALKANSFRCLSAIEACFPEGTKVSHPDGGFVLWVELDRRINTLDLFETALRQHISIAPGRMFTLQEQFNHCMRISYGLKWTPEMDKGLKQLGRLIRKQL